MSSVLSLALAATLVAGPAGPPAPAPGPYTDPPFGHRCSWSSYGDGVAPPLNVAGREPLCVKYSKRDITADNGGALAFLLAEPARFAVAIPACRYWQIDHWRVRLSGGDRPLLRWDGSYWFDRSSGAGGVRLTGFALAGRPIGVGSAAALLRPRFPRLAGELARYGRQAGESGVSVRANLPEDLPCGT